jgi:hypothetical protein
VNVVVRCNDRVPVVSFYERDHFSHQQVGDAIDKVLFCYYNVHGQWRRPIVIWLFQILNGFLDSY